jgi:hypothetical protein
MMVQTMPSIEAFMESVIRDLRTRLALLNDCGERRAVEDGIALLTDFRLSDMDQPRFERLLASLRSGRSPVGLSVLKPEAIARELSERWLVYTAANRTPALN